MTNLFTNARTWLASIDPAAPAAALILIVFFTVYAVRRYLPNVWNAVTAYVPDATQIDPSPVLAGIGKLLQALPGALYGAAVNALVQGLSVKTALEGVGAGLVAAIVHEVMANYKGKVGARNGAPPAGPNDFSSKRLPKDPKPPSIPPLAAAILLGALALTGCAFFESKVPALEKCAPTPAALAAQVADILAAGGDYKSELEQLALKDTEQVVLCAVQAFVASKPTASPSNLEAQARGRAYLESKGIK